MANFLDISVALIVISIFGVTWSDVCVEFSRSNPCLCVLPGDTKIDLSNLINNNTEKDGYISDTQGNTTFYFSGCKNTFNQSYSLWKNVTFITGKDHNITINVTSYGIGRAEDVTFIYNESSKYYDMDYVDSKGSINATINLLCDRIRKPFLKILDPDKNVLALSSPEVCEKTIENHNLSGGSVFLLILFITAVMYFIGGGLLLYFIRGARGIEVIPNVDFWRNLPGLVKDGTIYLLSGCRPTFVSSAESYDRI